MISLNLEYNNDDKKGKKQLEINRIGNKTCWINNWISAKEVD